jgi:hypothetical protein
MDGVRVAVDSVSVIKRETIVQVVSLPAIIPASAFKPFNFTATEDQTSFEFPTPPSIHWCAVEGVIQYEEKDFEVVGKNLVFYSGIPGGYHVGGKYA